MSEAQPIRAAATIVLARRRPAGPEVLMGQRGAGAVFMPSKYVFPGGAVDAGDAGVTLAQGLAPHCAARLRQDADGIAPETLATAAIRELWEETGLRLAAPGLWDAPPADWASFAAPGLCPSAAGLSFVFRAITPPGRTRRFDARFFLANAARVLGDTDDFSDASDELSHLHWVPLAEARRLDLPFVTEIVLAEVEALIEAGVLDGAAPDSVPFFDNSGPVSQFRRLV